jgi:hypothetical protein
MVVWKLALPVPSEVKSVLDTQKMLQLNRAMIVFMIERKTGEQGAMRAIW